MVHGRLAMNSKPISCLFHTPRVCQLQIRNYWACSLTNEETKVHECLANYPNHRVRKELEVEPEYLIFSLKALSWARLKLQLNHLLPTCSWAHHANSLNHNTFTHTRNTKLYNSRRPFLWEHNACTAQAVCTHQLVSTVVIILVISIFMICLLQALWQTNERVPNLLYNFPDTTLCLSIF